MIKITVILLIINICCKKWQWKSKGVLPFPFLDTQMRSWGVIYRSSPATLTRAKIKIKSNNKLLLYNNILTFPQLKTWKTWLKCTSRWSTEPFLRSSFAYLLILQFQYANGIVQLIRKISKRPIGDISESQCSL